MTEEDEVRLKQIFKKEIWGTPEEVGDQYITKYDVNFLVRLVASLRDRLDERLKQQV